MPIAQPPPYQFFTLATNIWTAPYWEAASRGEWVAARCAACDHPRMPPTPFCPRCHHQGIRWVRLSGLATVYSYTVVERAIMPGMEAHLPYVPAVIEPDDLPGVRLVSNLVGMELSDLRVGLPVRLTWHHTDAGVGLTQFRLR